jgi:Tfp pilus assembly protein FimT
MLFKYGALSLGAVATVLLLAMPAQAHELTAKKAKNALKPVAAELVGTVGPAIAQKVPGATIAKSRVGGCEIKKSHRAECVITFSIQGATTGETECGLDALVRFKNSRSRQLKISTGPLVVCFFPVPLS